jgi:SAM-dependent methyltransferase
MFSGSRRRRVNRPEEGEAPGAGPDAVVPLRSFDAQGQVFVESNRVLRGIFTGQGDRCRRVLDTLSRNDLFRLGIVRTAIATNADLPGGPYDLILEHERVPFISYPHEWAASMLKDAAVFHLELFTRLAPYGLTLKDMHPLNVVFDGPRPIFVDFTSIVPMEALASEEYLQSAAPPARLLSRFWDRQSVLVNDMYARMFEPYFLLPLEMMCRGRYTEARTRMRETTLNTSREVITRREARGRDPGPRLGALWRRFALDGALMERDPAKARFFRRLARHVSKMDVTPPDSGYASYYDQKGENYDLQSSRAWNARQRTIGSILERLHPQTVLDVAGNTGWFARLAAKSGARAVSFDIDESSADHLYLNEKADGLGVLSLVMDLTKPTLEVSAIEYPNEPRREFEDAPVLLPATSRLNCDLVMALAIVHHLALGQNQSLCDIVDSLDRFTRRYLLMEFIDRDDELVVAEPEFFPAMHRDPGAFDWYRLENFEAVLRRRFASVERLPSHPESRTILLCTR